MSISIHAEQRQHLNRSGLKQLRKKGRLPGIIFGSGMDNAMIHISRKEFHQWAKGGGAGVVQLQLGDAENIPVLLEHVQKDPISQDYIHADFLRVKQDEEVRTKIPIQFTGTAKGTKQGGIIQMDSNFIEVQALPANLPTTITIDISDFDIGATLQGGDIKLPEGVALVSSANEYLLSVTAPRVAEEAAEEEAAE